MNAPARAAVLHAILGLCDFRAWKLLAVHVRSSHAHAVVKALVAPEGVLNQIKAFSTRAFKALPGEAPRERRWSRGGSTRYLWRPEDVEAAVHYVVHEQGDAMALHVAAPDPHDGSRHVHGEW